VSFNQNIISGFWFLYGSARINYKLNFSLFQVVDLLL
jgi:hypothetical protein